MRIVENVREMDRETVRAFPHLALTIGSFDGVHRGHQRILYELIAAARERHGAAAVMTMRPHPRELFTPDNAPNLLTSEKKKLALFEAAGVDAVLMLPFDWNVARMDRQEFLRDVICGNCRAEVLVVGHDFQFGSNALGDFDYLQSRNAEYGYEVRQVPPLMVNGERVSSTAIRERLLEGNLALAETFLGRKYSVLGEVIRGRGIGHTLGFPTANIRPYHTAAPAQGVYAGKVLLGNQSYAAAVNIGIAPTIRHEDSVIEAHLLDFDQDIRGCEIEIVFHARLRPEKKFASREALMEGIQADVATIREYFKTADAG